jgi:aspartyl protease family protein
VNNHLVALIIWLSLVVGGYLVIDHLSAPDPVVRSMANGGAQIVVPVARDGHFYLEGAVNGTPITFLVDTGASYVSIGSDLAARANLPEGIAGFFGTANGRVEGRIVRSQTVKADVFEVSGITVAVMPARSEFGLLGQNFLRHFTVSQSDGELILRMRER